MDPDPGTPSSRRWLARLGAGLLGLAAACLLAEVVTRVVLAAGGQAFDSSAAAERIGTLHSSLVDAAPSARRVDEAVVKDVRSQGQVLHPYFGYDFEGYFDSLPDELLYYRTPEADEAYDVVVLGGSVAMSLARPGIDALIAALRADPELASRPIHVTTHGRAAYKAPQQWLVLQFLLCAGARPDAVIALDGFNEVAVGLQNARQSVAGIYPCANVWLTLAGAVASDSASLKLALELRRRQVAVVEAAETYARRGLARSALASWIATQRIERLQALAAAAAAELERKVATAQSFDTLSGPFEAADDARWIAGLVRAWRESVLSLDALCSIRGIDFLEVLQPTALLEGSKPLTQRERDGAVAVDSWHTAIELGYPELLRTGADLAALGVPFLDATRVFAQVEETLYFDTCHFRPRGYELLAAEIGRALVAERARRRSAPR